MVCFIALHAIVSASWTICQYCSLHVVAIATITISLQQMATTTTITTPKTHSHTFYFEWKEFPNSINLKWHWFSLCKSGCTVFHLACYHVIRCFCSSFVLSRSLFIVRSISLLYTSVTYFGYALFVQPIVSSRIRFARLSSLQQYHIARISLFWFVVVSPFTQFETFCSSESFSWLLSIDRHRYSFSSAIASRVYMCVSVSLFRFAWFHKHNIFSDCFPFGFFVFHPSIHPSILSPSLSFSRFAFCRTKYICRIIHKIKRNTKPRL